MPLPLLRVVVTLQWVVALVLGLTLIPWVRRCIRDLLISARDSLTAPKKDSSYSMHSNVCRPEVVFLSHARSEEAFIGSPYRAPPAPQPPTNETVFRRESVGRISLYWYLLTTDFLTVVTKAASMALFAGGLGSIIEMGLANYSLLHGDWVEKYRPVFQSITAVYASFLTLPAFFIVFVLNSEVQRWLRTLSQCLDLCSVWCQLASLLAGLPRNSTSPGGPFVGYCRLLQSVAAYPPPPPCNPPPPHGGGDRHLAQKA